MGQIETPLHLRNQLWAALSASPNVMVELEGAHEHALPMRAHIDPQIDRAMWFYTSRDNRLAPGGSAMAHFVSTGHDVFACIAGTLTEERDIAVIDRFWDRETAAWYDKGREDPNLLVLRFDLHDAEIWTAHPTLVGRFKLRTGMRMREEQSGGHARVAL